MEPVLTVEQARAFDRNASEEWGVPSLLLMENAGRGAADFIDTRLASTSDRRACVVCGRGNNGGDGFVVARRLRTLGWQVQVLLCTSAAKLTPDAAVNHGAYVGTGGSCFGPDPDTVQAHLSSCCHAGWLVVDALYGTGLSRELGPAQRQLVECINRHAQRVVALDVPSGLDIRRGVPLGAAVRAHHTLTFAALKLGLLSSLALEHTGEVHRLDIGVPLSLLSPENVSGWLVEPQDVRERLTPRAISAHKGSSGRVLVLAGSPGKMGAALLACRGALRAGAGLVTLASRPEVIDQVQSAIPEVMTARLDPENPAQALSELLEAATRVVIGPGLGRDAFAAQVINHVAFEWGGCAVFDADALSHLARDPEALRRRRGATVLTPHPGELGRLLGITAREVEEDRFTALAKAVESTGATVLLKGPRTLVSDRDGVVWINASGTPALAAGGAGDVLSGVIAALLCRQQPSAAAWCAAHLHGRAAELWTAASGCDRGLLASQLADLLPSAMADVMAETAGTPR